MTALGWLLLGSSGAIILWATLLYPAGAWLIANLRPAEHQWRPWHGPVTLFIAARNEAEHLDARLENACAQRYPDLKIVVASDGSTDGTDDIARAFPDPRVSLVSLDRPSGKTAALSRAIEAEGRPGLWLFTDATASWAPDTVARLAGWFSDPSVGAVSGLVRYRYGASPISHGFSAYQSWVVPSRLADATVGWVTSVSGSICALRAELWDTAIPAELSTDLVFPLLAARHKQRAALDVDAVSLEEARTRASRELRSRIRLALSAYAFVGYLRGQVSRLPGRYLVQVFSHKVARWLSPACGVTALAGALLVYPSAPTLTLTAVTAATAALALGLLGLLPGIGRWFGAPLWALVVATGYIIGLVQFLGGRRVAGWDPADQR